MAAAPHIISTLHTVCDAPSELELRVVLHPTLATRDPAHSFTIEWWNPARSWWRSTKATVLNESGQWPTASWRISTDDLPLIVRARGSHAGGHGPWSPRQRLTADERPLIGARVQCVRWDETDAHSPVLVLLALNVLRGRQGDAEAAASGSAQAAVAPATAEDATCESAPSIANAPEAATTLSTTATAAAASAAIATATAPAATIDPVAATATAVVKMQPALQVAEVGRLLVDGVARGVETVASSVRLSVAEMACMHACHACMPCMHTCMPCMHTCMPCMHACIPTRSLPLAPTRCASPSPRLRPRQPRVSSTRPSLCAPEPLSARGGTCSSSTLRCSAGPHGAPLRSSSDLTPAAPV